MKPTLEQTKAMMRVTHTHEDELIGQFLNASILAIENRLEKKLVDTASSDTTEAAGQLVWNEALGVAVMMFADTLFTNREMIIPLKISDNPTVEYLLMPYRRPGL